MLDNMFGNLEEQQAKMAERLKTIKLKAEAGQGAITIDCNAGGEVENVSLAPEIFENKDVEQLEDLLTIAINRAFDLIKETEGREAKSMMKDILPPGMQGLFGG
jgi:DNA-binding YbaB/EbfC family protein